MTTGSNAELISRFRKMANDDPTNELAHYRLGELLMKENEFQEAITSFRRALELSPQFAKVYQFLGQSLLANGQRDEAIQVWKKGYAIADEQGAYIPRDEMARLLVEQGESAPVSKRGSEPTNLAGDGFRCQRPTCMMGSRARRLTSPPFNDELGVRIQQNICVDCWQSWLRDYSIKVINELRLDLSDERHQKQYDQYMLEFLGLEEPAAG